MTEKALWIGFLLLFGMFFSCEQYNKGQILALAEDCMETNPEKAREVLEKIPENAFDLEYQRATYAFLYTQAKHKCHIPLENDSLINIAVNFFTIQEERHLAAKSWLYKGLVHKQCKEAEKAAEAFAMSEQWFKGVEDDQYKALLHNHYGALMFDQANYKEALVHYKKSYGHKLKGDSIHYVAFACEAIGNTFRMLGQADSAKTYYEKALSYKEAVFSRQGYYRMLLNYATFLAGRGDTDKAEAMLLDYRKQLPEDSSSLYKAYSGLTTLYYNIKDYPKALSYAEKLLESKDSLILRGAYFHLYRIHTRLGDTGLGLSFYQKYNHYDDEISMRLKTTEVATIPHKVENAQLKVENKKGVRIQKRLAGWLLAVTVAGIAAYTFLRKRNRRKQAVLQAQLEEEQDAHRIDMEKAKEENARQHWDLGRKSSYIDRSKRRIERITEELEQEKLKTKEQYEEISLLKEEQNKKQREQRLLKRELDNAVKGKDELQEELDKVRHESAQKELIYNYSRLRNVNPKAIALLYQLKQGVKRNEKRISRQAVIQLLAELLEKVHPGLSEKIDSQTNSPTKRIICYLTALKMDDDTMMFRATGVRLETIWKYRKETLRLVEELEHGTPDNGNLKQESDSVGPDNP